jgi:hypothetical protein
MIEMGLIRIEEERTAALVTFAFWCPRCLGLIAQYREHDDRGLAEHTAIQHAALCQGELAGEEYDVLTFKTTGGIVDVRIGMPLSGPLAKLRKNRPYRLSFPGMIQIDDTHKA